MISKELINLVYQKNSNVNYTNLLNITKKRLDNYLKEESILTDHEINDYWKKKLLLSDESANINNIKKSTIDKIGITWIIENRVIPFDETVNKVKVFIDDINNIDNVLNVEKIFHKKSEIILKNKDEMNQILDILNANLKLNDNVDNFKVSKLLNSFIEYGIDNESSDIHFEYEKDYVGIRFRIDGVLNEMFRISHDAYQSLLNRVKISAALDLTNNVTPLDGHFEFLYNNLNHDIRVSIIPTLYGSRMVLRLFNNDVNKYQLENLGFDDVQINDIKNSLSKTGLIVVTGPTGSGKTTTLYSILNYLKNSQKNIMTIEDPVENEIENITQISLNKLDYSLILKSIVRQDPDIIMVGEIRDIETASNAIRLAQTGHLVLATIHSNDGLGVISKLQNMGIQKYLLFDTLKLIISQRLIRKPCKECAFEYQPSYELLQKLKIENNTMFMSTSGCKKCLNTGYKGRMMISEVIKIDDHNKNYIFDSNRKTLSKISPKIFMNYQVIEKLKHKEVTYDEIIRNGIID